MCACVYVCMAHTHTVVTNDVNACQSTQRGAADGDLLFIRRENIKETTAWNYYIGRRLELTRRTSSAGDNKLYHTYAA